MAKKVETNLTQMEMMRQAAVKEFGEAGVQDAVTFFDSVYGVPLDGLLALQYVLGMDIIPLSSAISFVGKEGSLKSLLSWELIWRIMKSIYGGMGVYLDVEKKTDPAMVRGIGRNDVLFQKYISRIPLDRMSQFTRSLTEFGKLYDRLCPRRDIPMVFFLDSLGALSSDTGIEAMEEHGSAADAAGFDDARKAQELTKQLKAWVPTYLHVYPFLLIYVNHLKEKIQAEGAAGRANFTPQQVTPGAVHKDFMNAFTIECAKEKVQQTVKEHTVRVWITSRKAAFAHTGNRIAVTMHTTTMNRRYEDGDILSSIETAAEKEIHKRLKELKTEDTIRVRVKDAAAPGISAEEIEAEVKIQFEAMVATELKVQRKYVYFDWDTALTELLTRDNNPPCSAEAIKSVVDIKKDGSKYNSKRLGLKEVSAEEMGRAIQADPEIVEGLQDVLGITRKRKFETK